MIHQAARITGISEENYRVKTLTLELALPAARPGQFAMVWLPNVNERPLSLLDADPVRFTVARVGAFTVALHDLRLGDRLWVRGPLGQGFTVRGRHLLLVGGGYGVAPLHFLARAALAAGAQVSVVIGARTAADLLFMDRFAALGVPVITTTDDGSAGRPGLVTAGVEHLLATATTPIDQLAACGPGPMLTALERLAAVHHLPAQLSWENRMRCGMGICGTCAKDGWLVCSEGPVRRT
ncbi:MAG: dihydroorotate dehydrogenase electron transfer subunit [Anaerolineae bacterium]